MARSRRKRSRGSGNSLPIKPTSKAEWQPLSLEDLMAGWFRGSADAVHFASLTFAAAQEWDDLEDEGKCAHNDLISWLAFGKEYHPYFKRHADLLRPMMLSVYLQWTAANVLDREDVSKSYMLRAGVYGLFHMIAWIEGGNAHAAAVGPDIYRAYAETLDGLREELACQPQ